MATFVHITNEANAARIRKGGIARGRRSQRGVFCFPVVPDFQLTHQWARELRRWGSSAKVCVRFVLPDDEPVTIGKFSERKARTVLASEAVAIVLAHTDPAGLEVIVPRRVEPSEIRRVYPAPRLAGWRYYPAAKGKKPCFCKFCNRGEIRAQRLMRRDPDRV
ncbi:MAG: hypothetical protein JST92_06490 [Deltaproteobacteria bacterium]|nr:hypothetical protein [Deltaproteobacteria bacterium]